MMDHDGNYTCPHCNERFADSVAASNGKSVSLPKSIGKKVSLSILIHPQWLKGSGKVGPNGEDLGGSVTDSPESTQAWNNERAKQIRLVEVRGELPERITCPQTGDVFYTDGRGGNVPKQSTFACKESTCGQEQDVLSAIPAVREDWSSGNVCHSRLLPGVQD